MKWLISEGDDLPAIHTQLDFYHKIELFLRETKKPLM